MPHAQSAATIYYDDRGKGEPALLFTPGWWATREAYGHLPELCSARRRTLALECAAMASRVQLLPISAAKGCSRMCLR
jgi:hypothetical protein